MHTTRRDHDNQRTLLALAHLAAAQDARVRYDELLHASIAQFGDVQHGRYISGIYADHFPDPVKDQLRFYARLISEQTDHALRCWARAGRRVTSLRPYLRDARQLAGGRESYY